MQSTRSPKDGEPTDILEEKLLQWQQARIQRQIKGEYQSQIFRLNELVSPSIVDRHNIWYSFLQLFAYLGRWKYRQPFTRFQCSN